MRLYERKVTY